MSRVFLGGYLDATTLETGQVANYYRLPKEKKTNKRLILSFLHISVGFHVYFGLCLKTVTDSILSLAVVGYFVRLTGRFEVETSCAS